MKFLVDRCAGHRLAEWLKRQGHNVLESRQLGPDPGDRVLLEKAAQEGRVLITMDKDFGRFIFSEGIPHCGLVRLPDVPSTNRIVIMEQVLTQHSEDLLKRSIVTVRGGRIRISFVE